MLRWLLLIRLLQGIDSYFPVQGLRKINLLLMIVCCICPMVLKQNIRRPRYLRMTTSQARMIILMGFLLKKCHLIFALVLISTSYGSHVQCAQCHLFIRESGVYSMPSRTQTQVHSVVSTDCKERRA